MTKEKTKDHIQTPNTQQSTDLKNTLRQITVAKTQTPVRNR